MSRAYARRLLGRLNLPEESERLLRERKFQTIPVFEEIVQLCDRLHIEDPKAALQLARIAPALAESIDPRGLKPDLRLRGLAALGAAHRAMTDLATSESAYAEGLAFIDACSPLVQVDFYWRFASLRRNQRRFDEALSIVDLGIRLYRQHGDLVHRKLFGLLLNARAQIHFEQGQYGPAIEDLSEALNHFDPKRHQTYYYAVLHNLAFAMVHQTDVHSLGRALARIETARRQLSYQPEHYARFKLRWLEGLANIRFGSSRKGERLLDRARAGFVKMELPQEVALISLDIGLLYLSESRHRELRHLAAETYELFARLSVDREALAALNLWTEAVQAERVSEELVARVRDRLNAGGTSRP